MQGAGEGAGAEDAGQTLVIAPARTGRLIHGTSHSNNRNRLPVPWHLAVEAIQLKCASPGSAVPHNGGVQSMMSLPRPPRLRHGHSPHTIERRCWKPTGFDRQDTCGARLQRRYAPSAAPPQPLLTTALCPPCSCVGPPPQPQTAATAGRRGGGEAAAARRRRHRHRRGRATRAPCLHLQRAPSPGCLHGRGKMSRSSRRMTSREGSGGGGSRLAAGSAGSRRSPTAKPGCLAPSTWTPRRQVTPPSCRPGWRPWLAPRTRRRGGPARRPTPEAAAGSGGGAHLLGRR